MDAYMNYLDELHQELNPRVCNMFDLRLGIARQLTDHFGELSISNSREILLEWMKKNDHKRK